MAKMEPSQSPIGRLAIDRTAEPSAPAPVPAEFAFNEATAPFDSSRESSSTAFEPQSLSSKPIRDHPRGTTSPVRGHSIFDPPGRVRQRISWSVPDSNVIHQPRPRRRLPSLSLLDRQARRFSDGPSTPEFPDDQPQKSHARGRERADTMYQQSNKSYASLMTSWTRKLDKDAGKDQQRSRSVLGLSSFRSASRDQRLPPKRPASTGYEAPENRQSTPRVRPLRRFSWQKTQVAGSDAEDGEWRHREGPLVLISDGLPSVSEDEAMNEPISQDSNGDDESITAVIHRPVSPHDLPSRQTGYTGSMPRYYPIALEMANLPSPSPALGVLFPGEPLEQVRAQVAQMHLELAKKEEELSRTKHQLAQEQEAAALARIELKKAGKQAKKREERLREFEEENAAL